MIRPNSCLGYYSLQTGTKLAAIFQMIIAVALLVLSIKRITDEERFDSWVYISAFIIMQVLFGIFSYMLFEGSKERNLRHCKLWIYATSCLIVGTGIYLIFELYDNSSLRFYTSPSILLSIVSIFLNIGFIWITYGFIYELEDDEGDGNYHS